VVLLVALLAAELAIRLFHISSYLLPTPSAVLHKLLDERVLIAQHLGVTSVEALGGFAGGVLAALVVSILFVYVRPVERGLFPLAIVLQTVPVVVIAPILIIAFGNGLIPKAVIAGIISFFPALVNLTRGLNSVDPLLLDLFATYYAPSWKVLLKLRLPASLPFLFSALRIASANCFIGALVAEWIGAERGIGYLIQIRMYQLNIESLYASVAASSAAAVLFFGLIALVERITLPWKQVAETGAVP
jgi:ABC-type nitrate/sulfonate/bicarbonate transport system permease component